MYLKRIYHKLLMILPKSLAHKILYYRLTGKKLNLSNPITLEEKIHYLIIHKYNEEYGLLTDKYMVREFIKSKGYEKLLPKIYGVYDNANDICFDKLPNAFVLKTNHGSGKVYICKNKKNFDIETCKYELNESLKKNFAEQYLEYHYSYIKPRIICEEYLNDGQNEMPLDYKFYCFDGKVECILLCSEREKKVRLDYYDLDWKYLNYAKEEYRSNKKHNKPKNLKNMITIAANLSKGFDFVRVDLYEINGKIYFGELTFSPSAGILYKHTEAAIKYLGSKLTITK